jgi:hypothetical protein
MFGPSYAAGCPTCSSIADSVNGVRTHLNARDVTMLFISQAPLETLRAFKRRMGWSLPWVSSASSEFNIDLGFSSSQEQTREWAVPMLEQLPPIAARNARETGTDVVGYLTESFGFSAFVLDDGAVYQTYSAGPAGSSSSWATTRSSTGHREAARRAMGSSCGSAATTNTTASDTPWRRFMTTSAQTFTVLADELTGAARAALWPALVAEYPTLGDHQAKTTRQFPVFMLTRQD